MKVYKINFDVNHYQKFFLVDRKRVENWVDDPMLQFDGTPIAEVWKPLEVFVFKPKYKVPHFWSFELGGVIVADLETAEKMALFFGMAGEELPLMYEGKEYRALNILQCLNNLDRDKSTWLTTKSGERVYPKRHVFHSDRFSESPLFKIPDDNCTNIFTWVDTGDPESEFKAAVEHYGLKGLLFELAWEG